MSLVDTCIFCQWITSDMKNSGQLAGYIICVNIFMALHQQEYGWTCENFDSTLSVWNGLNLWKFWPQFVDEKWAELAKILIIPCGCREGASVLGTLKLAQTGPFAACRAHFVLNFPPLYSVRGNGKLEHCQSGCCEGASVFGILKLDHLQPAVLILFHIFGLFTQ